MTEQLHRYEFEAGVVQEDIDAALVLALWGTESLHGEIDTRINANYTMDEATRVCLIDAGTVLGRDFSRLFHGYLKRELREEAFQVKRVERTYRTPELAGADR